MLRWISFVALTTVLLVSGVTSTTFARDRQGTSHKRIKQGSVTKRKSPQVAPDFLTDEDRAAIRALDSTFVRGWLSDDTNAVLSVFAADAVLLPPGSKPVRGLPAIRSYWWPVDGSHTRITSFDRHIDEIEGTRQLAFLRGTASLSWIYEKDGHQTAQTSRSIDLLLLARDSAGHWHVIRQMWNTLPD
jgi:uncharacterized protein (TIGR02246 family)